MKKTIFGGFLLLSGCVIKLAQVLTENLNFADDLFFSCFSLCLIIGGIILGFFGIFHGSDD